MLFKFNNKNHPNEWKEKDRKSVIDMNKNNVSVSEIAKHFSRSRSSIENLIKRQGWKINNKD